MKNKLALIAEKERKLAQYLESSTTEEVLLEIQIHIPTLRTQPNICYQIKKLTLPQPVKNALIFYLLVTNKQTLSRDKLITLADLCRKYKIKSAHTAIKLLKKHYLIKTRIYNKRYKYETTPIF